MSRPGWPPLACWPRPDPADVRAEPGGCRSRPVVDGCLLLQGGGGWMFKSATVELSCNFMYFSLH